MSFFGIRNPLVSTYSAEVEEPEPGIYVGYVQNNENGNTYSTGIRRAVREHAKEDAQRMLDDMHAIGPK